MKNDWPVKMTKTREEMNALDLPWGGGEALVLQDNVTDQTRWSTIHELTFRLPNMPSGLAYRTTYSKGSTECQDERPWEHSPAECVLVQQVPQIAEVWVPASEKPNVRKSLLNSARALAGRKVRDFVPEWNASTSNLMAAENMTPEWHQRLADNVGQRVRLTRMVTYEGDNTAVLQTVAASLQPGKSYGNGTYTVSVREVGYGRVEDLEQPRIVVARLDPDTMVGIAPCDDGGDGWVVMAVQPDPDGPTGEVIAPVGDEHGMIVYVDILDAAEVLKTGIVWKHDMGDGEADTPAPAEP